MKMLHSTSSTTYSTTMQPAERSSQEILSVRESMRIYFTILFGVGTVILTYYYLLPNMH